MLLAPSWDTDQIAFIRYQYHGRAHDIDNVRRLLDAIVFRMGTSYDNIRSVAHDGANNVVVLNDHDHVLDVFC